VNLEAEIGTLKRLLATIEAISSQLVPLGNFEEIASLIGFLVYGDVHPVRDDFYNYAVITHLTTLYFRTPQRELRLEPHSGGAIQNLPFAYLVIRNLSAQSQVIKNQLVSLIKQQASELRQQLLCCCL
jgi:hypothetical protein